MNAGLNFFGTNNEVAAGPGPLALAASAFQDGLTVTQTNPGIAINNDRIGGTALTRGQSSTVLKAQAGPVSKIGVGGTKTVNAAGATTVSNNKIGVGGTKTVNAAGATTVSNKKYKK